MPSYCLIIPCYNEYFRLPQQDFLDFLKEENEAALLFVNDGSTDKTLQLLESIELQFPKQVSILNLKTNVGKAEAVRQAMLKLAEHNEIDWVGYFDADLATPLMAVNDFFNFLDDKPSTYFIMGARVKMLGFDIRRSNTRHYFGRLFATFASLVLKIPVYDTQCGAKFIRKSLIPAVFGERFISTWIFDVEIIARLLKIINLQSVETYIIEIPLKTWIEKGDSKIRLSSLIRIPYQLYKIYRTYS